jgi:hypothetical protein
VAPTEEPAQQTKPVGPQPKLRPDMPFDYWKQRFQTANPDQYRQFKNKTPEKKDQMAAAAYYDARQPKATKK